MQIRRAIHRSQICKRKYNLASKICKRGLNFAILTNPSSVRYRHMETLIFRRLVNRKEDSIHESVNMIPPKLQSNLKGRQSGLVISEFDSMIYRLWV
jgi:hypothetical protein